MEKDMKTLPPIPPRPPTRGGRAIARYYRDNLELIRRYRDVKGDEKTRKLWGIRSDRAWETILNLMKGKPDTAVKELEKDRDKATIKPEEKLPARAFPGKDAQTKEKRLGVIVRPDMYKWLTIEAAKRQVETLQEVTIADIIREILDKAMRE